LKSGPHPTRHVADSGGHLAPVHRALDALLSNEIGFVTSRDTSSTRAHDAPTEKSWYGKCYWQGDVMPAHVGHDSQRSQTDAEGWTDLAAGALLFLSGARSRRLVSVGKASPTPFPCRGIRAGWPPFAAAHLSSDDVKIALPGASERGEIALSLITHRVGRVDAPAKYRTFREKQDQCINLMMRPADPPSSAAHRDTVA
jgi:hypothetical protein